MQSDTDLLIPSILEKSASKFPERPIFMVNENNKSLQTISYSNFSARVKKLASFIINQSIKKGSHIALIGKNSIDWSTAYFAILNAGCVVVPIDKALRAQEIRHLLRHSDSCALFIESDCLNVLNEGEEKNIKLPTFELKNIDKLADASKGTSSMRLAASRDETAVIIYTSGTTGSPKGVMLSHRNITENIRNILPYFDINHEDVFLSVLPVHHSFEATTGFLLPISVGSGICYSRKLRAKELLEDIKASNATIMIGVPLLYEKFYSGIKKGVKEKGILVSTIFDSILNLSSIIHKSFSINTGKYLMKSFRQKVGFFNMRIMITGGAGIRPEVVEFFNGFGINFVQGYGLSETSPVITINPINKNKYSSIGTVISCCEVKIASPDNKPGEILVRGENVFKKYYKNPEASLEAFTDDGWFKTGDLGYMDNEGYLYIMGRAKNVIVTAGGKNVQPEELEEKINQSPLVLESLVVGKKNNVGAEEPYAVIVPNFDSLDEKFGSKYDDEELKKIIKTIIDKVNESSASYKRIIGFKIQHEEFPKTSTRKIKRYIYTLS